MLEEVILKEKKHLMLKKSEANLIFLGSGVNFVEKI